MTLSVVVVSLATDLTYKGTEFHYFYELFYCHRISTGNDHDVARYFPTQLDLELLRLHNVDTSTE